MLEILKIICFFIFLQVQIQSGLARKCTDTWACDDGELIEMDHLCDGKLDCLDASDETPQNCIDRSCPTFAFRCTYGACISRRLLCDGKPDCIDSSDEYHTSCSHYSDGGLEALEKSLRGKCSEETSFQCESGECINDYYLCDGEIHCSDGSDETLRVCSKFLCPSYAFVCSYGACIAGNAQCNGIRECFDGSDEFPNVCGCLGGPDFNLTAILEQNKTDMSSQTSVKEEDQPTTKAPVVTIDDILSSCLVPGKETSLVAENFETKKIIPAGSLITENKTIVNFYCSGHKRLQGEANNICFNGTWLISLPNCTDTVFCRSNELQKSYSRQDRCFYKDVEVFCDEPLQNGSVVEVKCAPGYRKQNKDMVDRIVCQDDGHWSDQVPRCKAICGIASEGIPEDLYPWVVSVFKEESDGNYHYKCRGHIISERVVVADPNCIALHNNDFNKPDEPMSYVIVEGNFQRTFADLSYMAKPYHNVSELLLPRAQVNPAQAKYIALLILDTIFRFSPTLGPVCLPPRNRQHQFVVDINEDTSAENSTLIDVRFLSNNKNGTNTLRDPKMQNKHRYTLDEVFKTKEIISPNDVLKLSPKLRGAVRRTKA